MSIHPYTQLVAGAWIDCSERLRTTNPSDLRDVVGEYACADPELVERAIAAAHAAQPAWTRSTPQQRFDILDAIGSEILARKDELGDLLAREEGKPIAEARGEVTRAGQIFKFFAGEALRNTGEYVESTRPGVEVMVRREPVGVVGLITPWNFPIAIPAWKVAPALAYGNCVVLKPSEVAPGCAWALAEIISRSALPAGVFNLTMGGAETGKALAHAPDLDALSFTGSVATGSAIAQAAIGNNTKLQLEMGGKNPLVVLDDADLELAVECAVNGAYFSCGERCTASSRFVVTDGIYDRFVSALTACVKDLRVGDARAKETQVGPLVNEAQMRKTLDYIRIGIDEGASLLCGGEALTTDPPGYFVSPALFTDTTPAMRINREEIFGPVATIQRARDYDEAVTLANDTPFGLSAGIVTTSSRYAQAFQRDARAGLVMVNLPTAGVDYHVPFGGTRASSYGPREQGSYAREFYTTVKTVYVKP